MCTANPPGPRSKRVYDGTLLLRIEGHSKQSLLGSTRSNPYWAVLRSQQGVPRLEPLDLLSQRSIHPLVLDVLRAQDRCVMLKPAQPRATACANAEPPSVRS